MRHLLPLLLCAACSPTVEDPGKAATSPHAFATQIRAPSPDYRALLDATKLVGEGGRQREATSTLPADAKAIGDAWIARLKKRGALLGYGLVGKGPDGSVEMIDTGLTEQEFESWAGENGWRVPRHIRWSFAPAMNFPRVSERAIKSIRVWPASTQRTGPQPQALFSGRIELRDGCFFVGQWGKPVDKLAWFHAEMGLDVDSSGYFILLDRVSGQTLARLGEDMNWGGPATADIDEKTERALRDACGPAEIHIVGSPEASERFNTKYPHMREPRVPPPPPPPPP
jgi:hypothetical protein